MVLALRTRRKDLPSATSLQIRVLIASESSSRGRPGLCFLAVIVSSLLATLARAVHMGHISSGSNVAAPKNISDIYRRHYSPDVAAQFRVNAVMSKLSSHNMSED